MAERTCDEEHPLRSYVARMRPVDYYGENVICDNCRGILRLGDCDFEEGEQTMHHCSECDYDLCDLCFLSDDRAFADLRNKLYKRLLYPWPAGAIPSVANTNPNDERNPYKNR